MPIKQRKPEGPNLFATEWPSFCELPLQLSILWFQFVDQRFSSHVSRYNIYNNRQKDFNLRSHLFWWMVRVVEILIPMHWHLNDAQSNDKQEEKQRPKQVQDRDYISIAADHCFLHARSSIWTEGWERNSQHTPETVGLTQLVQAFPVLQNGPTGNGFDTTGCQTIIRWAILQRLEYTIYHIPTSAKSQLANPPSTQVFHWDKFDNFHFIPARMGELLQW